MECVAIRRGGKKKNKKNNKKNKNKGKQNNAKVQHAQLKQKNKQKRKRDIHEQESGDGHQGKGQGANKKPKTKGKGSYTALQTKFKQKLEGSQFRWLNEQLYTKTSDEAYTMIKQNTALFDVYHKGFVSQVSKWPENPVDTIIDFLRTLPRKTTIGDFGCGDARIARTLSNKMPNIHSFDLAKPNKHVTICNIKNVPLKEQSLDVAIFCLSLMGTDFIDFIREANRVLKVGGTLIVAEVKSRFSQQNPNSRNTDGESSNKSMIAGIESFVTLLSELGFENVSADIDNHMFVLFQFEKMQKNKNRTKSSFVFKACKYKKR